MANSTSFKPGQGGRKKGSQNKTTIETKIAIQNLLDNIEPDLITWFRSIEAPERKIELFIKLSEYIVPKPIRVNQPVNYLDELDIYFRQR